MSWAGSRLDQPSDLGDVFEFMLFLLNYRIAAEIITGRFVKRSARTIDYKTEKKMMNKTCHIFCV
jgi:hypothetical protein